MKDGNQKNLEKISYKTTLTLKVGGIKNFLIPRNVLFGNDFLDPKKL